MIGRRAWLNNGPIPLAIVHVGSIAIRLEGSLVLAGIDLTAFGLHRDQALIDGFHLGNQLTAEIGLVSGWGIIRRLESSGCGASLGEGGSRC